MVPGRRMHAAAAVQLADAFDPPPARIAVFRALHLGDLLCTVPALRAVRAAAPQARITLIGLPWAQSFVERFPAYVDELLPFSGFPGFPEKHASFGALRRFIRIARSRRFDLVIQLHGTGSHVNSILGRLGAARCAGFHPPQRRAPSPWFMPWLDRGHEIRRYLRLVHFLGAPDCGEALEFPLSDADRAEAAQLRQAHGLPPRGYVCVHAGARLPSRRWPPARFAEVAQALAGEGWRIALTGSPSEAPIAAALIAAVAESARAKLVNLVGATTLGGLAALVADARLLLSNDTGLAHVAAAVGVRSVIVASGSDVARWAPLDGARHRVLAHDVPCRPCAHSQCPVGHPCALGVDVGAVLQAAQEALGTAA